MIALVEAKPKLPIPSPNEVHRRIGELLIELRFARKLFRLAREYSDRTPPAVPNASPPDIATVSPRLT